MTRRPWTMAEIRRLYRLAEELGTIREAAAQLGRSYAGARAILRRNGGSPPNCTVGGYRRFTDQSGSGDRPGKTPSPRPKRVSRGPSPPP